MNSPSILALSSSREGNKAYLETAAPLIVSFLGNSPLNIAFIPFASVDNDFEAYTNKVRKALVALPYTITTVTPENAATIIEACDVVMTGGGNTFKLLHDIYALNLLELIKTKVAGGTPYIGWSAGANLTGPTISTTNDMPVIQPQSFTAFGFFPFHINPHYYNIVMEGFNGETRDQRLAEFLKLNQSSSIVCLPEGTAVAHSNGQSKVVGSHSGSYMFMKNNKLEVQHISPGSQLPWLTVH